MFKWLTVPFDTWLYSQGGNQEKRLAGIADFVTKLLATTYIFNNSRCV